MNISILTLAVVFLLIAIRQIGSARLQIWQIMLGGAVFVIPGFDSNRHKMVLEST